MILRMECRGQFEERELARFREYLETYFTGLEDPLGCDPACRLPDHDLNTTCDNCIKEYIDYLVEKLRTNREIDL